MAENISITADPREKITVSLVGVEYEIFPPKAALGLKLAVRAKQHGDDPVTTLESVTEWVQKAFGKPGARDIEKRIEDEADDLDITHVMQLMNKVVELTTGNPTSSS